MFIAGLFTIAKTWKQPKCPLTDEWIKKMWRKKGTLIHYWWECKLVQPLWKTVWRFLKKLKIELPYDPANSRLGIYLKKTKNADLER